MNAPLDPLPEHLRNLIGQSIRDLPTPCAVVDLDALNRNVQRMAEYCARHHVRLRPHAKTHKSADLAKLQMQAGAVGVCVQKVSEAEALILRGVSNVLITNEVIASQKLMRVAQLAQWLADRKGQLGIVVDSPQGVEALATAMQRVSCTIEVYIEINVGQNRCGVEPGVYAVPLATAIARHPRLKLVGLQAYNGKVQHQRSPIERQDTVAQLASAIAETRRVLKDFGYSDLLVTGGGTGAFAHEVACGEYQEIQAGSYLFMDAEYAENQLAPVQPAFEHSLFVLTQVMSTSTQHVVCDAGHKSHAIDAGMPKVISSSRRPELIFSNGGDEHGILRGSTPSSALPELGTLIWLVPGHCDPTVNLHSHLIGLQGGTDFGKVSHIIRVDARGCVQ